MGVGLALVGCVLGVSLLSHRFEYGGDRLIRPIPTLVTLLASAGVLYVAAVIGLRRVSDSRRVLIWVLAVGAVLRALFVMSTPICETDFYRYLWDGAATVKGYNPYAYVPQVILGATEEADEQEAPAALRQLGEESGHVLKRVNHADLGTIYPPVAQGAFAAAYLLRPWSLGAMRVVFLVFDVATLLLVIALLRRAGLPLCYLVAYWWNPVLIKETVNSIHMDVMLLPFVLGALLFATKSKAGDAKARPMWAAALLALAVGVKVWPVLLLPLVLRPLLGQPKRLMGALLMFAVVLGIVSIPLMGALRLGEDSGFFAYGKTWEMNDALFMAVHKATDGILSGVGVETTRTEAAKAARWVTMALVGGITLLLSYRRVEGPRDIAGRALFIVAALFLLSPTQYPWYCVWMIPMLALRPQVSLLALAALLPVYYLRFYFDVREKVGVFDNGIVWIEFGPVFLLIALEGLWWIRHRKGGGEQCVPAPE